MIIVKATNEDLVNERLVYIDSTQCMSCIKFNSIKASVLHRFAYKSIPFPIKTPRAS